MLKLSTFSSSSWSELDGLLMPRKGSAGGSTLWWICLEPLNFSQDHKRNLICDVEKLQAWQRLIWGEEGQRGLGWFESGSFPPELTGEVA